MNYKKQKNSVEIICIGSELLLGNILNSNARWIAEELAALALPHYRQMVLGDNIDRLKSAILEASERCEILITTGGLGPTQDDITTISIASAFNSKLKERKDILLDIKNKLGFNGNIAENNYKQALLPIDAEILPNKNGTAPGMIWSPKENFTIITFPGVPSELKQMWTDSALPWLKRNKNSESILLSKTLRFTGIRESNLAEKLDILLQSKNPTIAPYASLGEVKLRITAKANSKEEANNLISPMILKILETTKSKCFSVNNESLPEVIINLLQRRCESISIAESCSGGLLGSSLTSVVGASSVFLGGIISYSNKLKTNLLGVPVKLIENNGAVSQSVAEAMAIGIRNETSSDWSIAITGIAGPTGGSSEKPIGLVYISIIGPKNFVDTKPYKFNPRRSRQEIQRLSVLKALDEFRLFLLATS